MINRIKQLLNSYEVDQSWKVLVKKTDQIDFDFSKENIEIRNSMRYWYADPFLITVNDKVYLFVEVFDKFLNRGSIGYFDLENKNLRHKTVLKKQYHMSYPFVFIINGEYYMIPETSEIKEVSIYKAIKFPDRWKKQSVIIENVSAVDTNLITYNNKLYMISAITKNNSNVVEEVIYELDENFSIIKLISKKRLTDYGARNAGDFWINQNKILRFTQDCRNDDYGKGIIKSEFTPFQNNVIEYFSYSKILYSNNSHCGFHTISYRDGYLAVDIKYVKKSSSTRKLHLAIISVIKSIKRRLTK